MSETGKLKMKGSIKERKKRSFKIATVKELLLWLTNATFILDRRLRKH